MAKPIIRVVVFKWHREGYRSKFDSGHVNTAARMVARHTTIRHHFVCITDDPTGIDPEIKVVPLWEDPHPAYGGGNWPNCFRRLRMFAPDIRRLVGPRWVWMDLDMLICGNIDHILTDPADFRIWRPDGGRSLCNGSLVLHQSGTRPEIWTEFGPEKVGSVEEFQAQTKHLGSDQAWISSRLRPDDLFFDSAQGVYAFPSDARDRTRPQERGRAAPSPECAGNLGGPDSTHPQGGGTGKPRARFDRVLQCGRKNALTRNCRPPCQPTLAWCFSRDSGTRGTRPSRMCTRGSRSTINE